MAKIKEVLQDFNVWWKEEFKVEFKERDIYREIQQFQCKNCKKFFSPTTQENKTYPLKIILKSISSYNLGYKLGQVFDLIKLEYKLNIPILVKDINFVLKLNSSLSDKIYTQRKFDCH